MARCVAVRSVVPTGPLSGAGPPSSPHRSRNATSGAFCGLIGVSTHDMKVPLDRLVIAEVADLSGAPVMLPAEDLFVHCYVLVDDLIKDGSVVIPARPGPAPACTDAEILTIGLVRHLLGRRSEAGFLAEIGREWPRLFPALPHPSEVNRRDRWLYGAYEQIRRAVLAVVPPDDWGQIDTSALPVKHPSRVRGPDSWTGPNELCARFGRDAAHGEWFYGFGARAGTAAGPSRRGSGRRRWS